ncbi:hypothetical protein [Aliikangiella maris]|uniref:Uncharacterized protein n=2 Tax=Aliikangiella maris TaxID=3162458 RepID=A0ABV2BXM1_9GAMM
MVELVNNGVLIHGALGDPNECGKPNYIFVSKQNSFFDSVLSMSLSALHSKKEMQFYAGTCTQVSFHWGSAEVINENLEGQPVYIR